jgi:phage recombination protein Bet
MNTGESKSLIATMAERYSLSPEEFKRVIKATCGLQKATDEEFLAFLMIAHEYDLNPVTREIYAFVKKEGGIQPIISVDGWYKKMNQHPAHNGLEFRDEIQGGQLVSVTAIIHRKDRTHPTEATEYMKECRRNTDPWRQWPARMLRHKAAIQTIRIAYNLAGIMDPEEAERYMDMLEGKAFKTVETMTIDDLPVPSSGRVKPTSDQAAEAAENTSPPHDEEPKKEQPAAPPPPAEPEPMVTQEKVEELARFGDVAGLSYSKLQKYVLDTFHVEALNELTKSQAAELSADLKRRIEQGRAAR